MQDGMISLSVADQDSPSKSRMVARVLAQRDTVRIRMCMMANYDKLISSQR